MTHNSGAELRGSLRDGRRAALHGELGQLSTDAVGLFVGSQALEDVERLLEPAACIRRVPEPTADATEVGERERELILGPRRTAGGDRALEVRGRVVVVAQRVRHLSEQPMGHRDEELGPAPFGDLTNTVAHVTR